MQPDFENLDLDDELQEIISLAVFKKIYSNIEPCFDTIYENNINIQNILQANSLVDKLYNSGYSLEDARKRAFTFMIYIMCVLNDIV